MRLIRARQCERCGGTFYRESRGVCIPCLDELSDSIHASPECDWKQLKGVQYLRKGGYVGLSSYAKSELEKRVLLAARNGRSLLEAAEMASVSCSEIKSVLARIRKRHSDG